ncbi:GNAT family N-acetyltransferase [Halobium salinum]|uniref:GNAT family N-acetyltransferase n=1 Tax=Halobium salinum TaxID=1364940 RepID=A0ABD5PDA1_9EURY|nr:GNAT family N-acetyltransferase [Halobium salinum]
MRIRPAAPDDAPGIAEVAREAWHAAYDDLLGPGLVDDRVDGWYDVERLREGLDAADHYVVAEVDSGGAGTEVVGYAAASTGVEGRPDDEATLEAIYVRPDHWGEGVGSRLLERVAGSVADTGIERLSAVVFADNEVGRAFYDRHGFAVRGGADRVPRRGVGRPGRLGARRRRRGGAHERFV